MSELSFQLTTHNASLQQVIFFLQDKWLSCRDVKSTLMVTVDCLFYQYDIHYSHYIEISLSLCYAHNQCDTHALSELNVATAGAANTTRFSLLTNFSHLVPRLAPKIS